MNKQKVKIVYASCALRLSAGIAAKNQAQKRPLRSFLHSGLINIQFCAGLFIGNYLVFSFFPVCTNQNANAQ